MEVMAAIFILLIGIVVIIALISKSISAGSLSASNLIAGNLAQEGIEVVKNIRDLNYNPNDPNGGWSAWFASGFTSGQSYSVQYDSQNLGGSFNNFLNYDSSTGRYLYNASYPNSPFKRVIILTISTQDGLGNTVEIKVISRVTWTERGALQTLEAEDRLWNWR